MVSLPTQNNWIKWAISGLLLGIGFVWPIIWPVGFLGGIYFLRLLIVLPDDWRKMLGGWLAWIVKSACATSIFWSAYPIEWIPVDIGNVQLLLIFIYWSTVSVWLGAGGFILVLLYRYINKYFPGFFYQLLILPVAWVVAEVLGSVVFSIMMYGSGGTLNAAYSLGYSGYLLAEHEILLQVAKFGGVYALSFIFCLAILLIVRLVKNQKRIYVTLGIVFLIYLSSFISYVPSLSVDSSNAYKIVVIDTYSDRAEAKPNLTDVVKEAVKLEPDYVLLPEDSRLFDQEKPDGLLKSEIKLNYKNTEAVLLDSGPIKGEGGTYLQAIVYNGQDNSIEKLHKRYLVPQGEFMPYLYSGLIGFLGGGDLIDYIGQNISYKVGPNTNQSQVSEVLPGILFCFESVDPVGVRRLMSERPNLPFVAHPISHTWFHESEILWHQLDTMLKIQAVWNGQHIVSAGNQAEAKVYAPNGYMSSLEEVDRGDGWIMRMVYIPKIN